MCSLIGTPAFDDRYIHFFKMVSLQVNTLSRNIDEDVVYTPKSYLDFSIFHLLHGLYEFPFDGLVPDLIRAFEVGLPYHHL